MVENGDFYAKFADVLGGKNADIVLPWLNKADHVSRLAIHQGNYRMTVTKAMQGLYKAVFRLVGEEYFAALLAAFIKEYPPSSSSLTLYGQDFSVFLKAFAPVQKDMPWLSPVARLDWAWFAAYGAANTKALHAQELLHVAPESLPARAPGLHASVTLLRFSVPAYSIWRTNIEDEDVQAIPLEKGQEWALVWRKDMQMKHAGLTQAQYIFLDSIGGGQSLAEGWTMAKLHDRKFDLGHEFAHWLNAGVFSGEHDD